MTAVRQRRTFDMDRNGTQAGSPAVLQCRAWPVTVVAGHVEMVVTRNGQTCSGPEGMNCERSLVYSSVSLCIALVQAM